MRGQSRGRTRTEYWRPSSVGSKTMAALHFPRRDRHVSAQTTSIDLSSGLATRDAVRGRRGQPPIAVHVVLRHPPCGEALLEPLSDPAAVEATDTADGFDGLRLGVYDEASDPVFDDLSYRSAWPRDDGGPAGHRFDHHQSERLRPVDRKQQGRGVAKEGLLLPVVHLANEPDIVVIEERLDRLVEIAIFTARHLGGNAQWQARAMGHPDRDIRTLLRRDPAQECEIAFRPLGEREQVRGHAVMNGGQPVEAGKWRALAL